ncbi:Threonine-phosphate decarboxylase [bioreactor metagenome]|uniref:histidinol-phosphate transaminase n=1 Tax=bioreactor metagenome TaxID=1076179 RepID=A0A645GGU1_9ZZZZ
MAGLRLGTLYCADRELLADIARFSPPWSVSAVAQAAGLAALDEPDWAERTRRLVERERPALAEGLEVLGLHVFPGQANYLLVKSERLLWAPLRDRGILLRACANFTGLDERFVRIGLKTETEHAQLLRAMKEVLHG